MASQTKVDKTISEIIEKLNSEKASGWSVQQKGVLLAAVKLQLQKQG